MPPASPVRQAAQVAVMKKRAPDGAAKAAVESIPSDSDAELNANELDLSESGSDESSYSSEEGASDVSSQSEVEDDRETLDDTGTPTAAAASDQDELDRAVVDYLIASQKAGLPAPSLEEAAVQPETTDRCYHCPGNGKYAYKLGKRRPEGQGEGEGFGGGARE